MRPVMRFALCLAVLTCSQGGFIDVYLLYLDESGTPGGWQDQKCYVLAGIALHEGQIYGLSGQIDSIQNKYFPGVSDPIGFHATAIRNGKDEFEQFQPAVRNQILDDLYTVFAGIRFPYLIAFATAIDKSAVTDVAQVRRDTLGDVCQRFNTFLVRQLKTGHPNKGLLIIDETRAEEYRELINDFKRDGTAHGYIDHIVDIPYFARCHETRMLQLADFVANAVYRYYEKGDNKYLNILLPRFDRKEPRHPPDGFKHIILGECNCLACYWRT